MTVRKKGGVVREALATMPDHAVPAGRFKATCLELMDQVEATGREIVITKYGVPVAKLVPVTTPAPVSGFGCMRDVSRILGDIVSPIEVIETADEHNFIA